MMLDVAISEVAVDAAGRLLVVPRLPPGQDFAQIYRAAMEVSWDANARAIVAPQSREWSRARWFQQIIRAAAQEYGSRLQLDDSTFWRVSSNVRAEIVAAVDVEQGR